MHKLGEERQRMHRLTLEMNDEAYALLEDLRKQTGKTRAELIRQGIVLRHFAQNVKQEGKALCVANGGGIEKEVLLL